MVTSTRSTVKIPISKAILHGLAPDGGLYVFTDLPTLDLQDLQAKDYIDIATTVFTALLDDFDPEAISRIVQETYGSDLFQPAPITMTHKGSHSYLNLFHGETFAFKDMALSILPKLVDEAKRIHNITDPSLILTATSGDTGSAALAGFSKNPDNYVFVLYPTDGVSPFQEAQMHQFTSDHCTVFPIDGNFDDCQTIVKELFQSLDLNHTRLISANSINIGRLIPQITYYVYTYFKLIQDNVISFGDPIDIVVPTGNFGNIYAAYVAKQMGLPFHQLVIASNTNNVLHDFFQTGSYHIDRTLYKTISPSMDIIISSNLERYLYDVLGKDSTKLSQLMSQLKETGNVVLDLIKSHAVFTSGMATEQDTLNTIQTVFEQEQLLIDPHTAVAKHVFDTLASDLTNHTVIVSTASPYKFVDAVGDALQLQKGTSLEATLHSVLQHTNTTLPPRMKQVLSHSVTKKQVLDKDQAFSILLRKVGTLDENQSTGN